MLRKNLKTKDISKALIIDIREDYEFEGFSIPGSINLPRSRNGKEEFQKVIDELRPNEIIVFCFCGRRSLEFIKELDCKYRILTKAYDGGIYKYRKLHRL